MSTSLEYSSVRKFCAAHGFLYSADLRQLIEAAYTEGVGKADGFLYPAHLFIDLYPKRKRRSAFEK